MRHKMSVPVNFQMASNEATTATRMQALVVQNEMVLTNSGFRKPRRVGRGWASGKVSSLVLSFSL